MNNSSNANKCSVGSGKIHSKGLKSLSELCSELAGNAVTGSFLEREVKGLNLGSAKSAQCCQRLAITATFRRKQLCCLGAMTQRWAPKVVTRFDVKLHLHGRLLAARIDILPFFFLKSRGHLHGARFT